MGDAVIVVVHHDFYDRELKRLGEGVSEIHRFTVRGNWIARLEVTTFDEIPEDVRERLAASDPKLTSFRLFGQWMNQVRQIPSGQSRSSPCLRRARAR